MGELRIVNQIKVVNPVASIDADYGPYNTIEEAIIAIPESLRSIGKTIGILTENGIVDYSWKTGILDEDIVVKVTKEEIGLSNVNNTSDVNKPVSTAQKAYVDGLIETESGLRVDGYQSLSDALEAVANGSPRGAYADGATLASTDPDHTYTYVTIDTGKWYYYDTGLTAWTIGGDYQVPLGVVQTLSGNETDKVPSVAVVNSLFQSLYKIEDTNVLESYDFVTDYYVSRITGLPVYFESYYSYIDYLECYSGKKYNVTSYGGDAAGVAFYDINKVFISGVQYTDNAGSIVEFTTPSNARYMRLSCTTSHQGDFTLTYAEDIFIIPDYKNDIDLLNENINDINDNIDVIETKIQLNNGDEVSESYDFVDDYYVSRTTGLPVTFASYYSYMDYLECYSDKNYNVTSYAVDYAGIAFYDINKIYISGFQLPDNAGTITGFSTPSNAKYMRISCTTSHKGDFSLTYAEDIILAEVNAINTKSNTERIEVLESELNISNNPCNVITREICTFDKILCIGDSITQGTFNTDTWYVTNGKYSYPTILTKLTGVETDNQGLGGLDTTQYWTTKENADWSGYDCAIIMLGINDKFHSSESTMAASLGNIVDKLKSESNRISIFVCTTISSLTYSTGYDTINTIIRDFVAGRTDCFLLDLQLYGNTANKAAFDGGHLTALGYWRLAQDLIGYISNIMNTESDSFRNIQFANSEDTPYIE